MEEDKIPKDKYRRVSILLNKPINDNNKESSITESFVAKNFEMIFNSLNDFIFIIDENKKIVKVNKRVLECTGFDECRLYSMEIKDILVLSKQNQAFGNNNYYLIDKYENKTIVDAKIINEKVKDKLISLIIARDISKLIKVQRSLEETMYYDRVTELPNRNYFKSFIKEELNKCENKLAILFLDIDNFKNINDTLGHSSGDILLKQAAGEFKACIEENGSVFRTGGDEYMFVLPDISSEEEVKALAENILSKINHPFYIDDREVYISGSIGITIFPDDGEDETTLLKNADAAMYYAKDAGKNNYQFFIKKMNDKIIEKSELESNLRHAIKNNEFIIHYQPQIDINSGKIIGMEALVRWNHPIQGIIPPIRFIPLAEETGLILPLGDFVLKKACEQTILWEKSGYGKINIAVNLSARQFDQKNLVEKIDAVLKETGLTPRQLEIEITESTAMKDLDQTVEVLKSLRKMGVRISLDDFGTGYSSLNYLRQLPIDTIKIDKTFVNNITNNDNEKAVARAIITLAHNMELNVVAEGVENNNQLSFLIDEQCDIIQGFLFSKPLSPEQFEELLIKYEK